MVCIKEDVGTVVVFALLPSAQLYLYMRGCQITLSYLDIYLVSITSIHQFQNMLTYGICLNKLLIYYDNMGPNSELTFKQLCRKIAVLFMLLEARRKQALLVIDISNVIVQTGRAILLPNKTLMHSNPKHPLQPFMHHSFSENENLCIVNCLKFYIGELNK